MKVLAISSNCFSKSNSNGRIFGCLFRQIGKENVAEFYVTDGINDYSICSNYFLFSDKDALKSILHGKRKQKDETKQPNDDSEKVSSLRSRFGRSAFMMICREILWSLSNWWNDELRAWLDNFGPDVVILQCGDVPFFYKIATKISIERNIPLILFNTEISYFIENSGDNPLTFSVYRRSLQKAMHKAINRSAVSIYNSDWLKEKFDQTFHKPSVVLYQSSDLSLQPAKIESSSVSIVYTGNLSWGRCYPLADIAKVLHEIDSDYVIDVYGVVSDQSSMNVLNNTSGLRYHGVVPYEEVKEVISKASILIVTENSDEEYARQTNFGFSGKITDCLFSGIPLLAYGPLSNVGIKYLNDNKAAQYVSSKDQLEGALRGLLFDTNLRKLLVSNAQKVAVENHDAQKNSVRFKEIIERVIS